MDQSTRAVRFARWAAIVQQCQARPENQTISQWFDERGINENTYFYWQRRVRRQAYHELQNSAELSVCRETGDVSFLRSLLRRDPEPLWLRHFTLTPSWRPET